MEEHKNGKMIF